MNPLDTYLAAAVRANTRKSYQSALRHFEVEWGSFLPATAESVARYLADHADQGFPDPTKAPIVRQALGGIQTLQPAQEKRARPLQLEQLNRVDQCLD